MPPHLLGALFALTSALSWGSGDWSGGVASRRGQHLQALSLSALSGVIFLAALTAVRGEWPISLPSFAWAAAAGASGVVGMAALYRGLALGNTALIAPTAAVLGALTPVLFGIAAEGLPSPAQLAGFAAGMGGIWLVTRGAGADGGAVRQGLLLAVVAGVGFGGFFVAIGQTGGAGLLFFPLAVAKATGFVLVTASLLARKAPTPAPQRNPIALLAGVLDAGGSIFYMLARAFTRLDVAAVLSSMYPVVTVILASLLLRETITRVQWLGIALCVLAVTLIII